VLNSTQGCKGDGAYPSCLGQEAGHTLDMLPVHHRATQRSTRETTVQLTLTTRVNLESPINLTYMFLGGRGKSEYPERTHAYTVKTCKLHTAGPSRDSNMEPSCCEATVLTTTPCPNQHRKIDFKNLKSKKKLKTATGCHYIALPDVTTNSQFTKCFVCNCLFSLPSSSLYYSLLTVALLSLYTMFAKHISCVHMKSN